MCYIGLGEGSLKQDDPSGRYFVLVLTNFSNLVSNRNGIPKNDSFSSVVYRVAEEYQGQ